MADVSDREQKPMPATRGRVARAVFSVADTMGITDRALVEKYTSEIIEKLELPQALPGMEHLVPKNTKQPKRLITDAEIEAMVLEVMVVKTGKPTTEQLPIKENTMTAKTKTNEIKLTDNARTVLGRRYLRKDKDGKPIEEAEDMLKRVARTIASAELVYNPQADAKKVEKDFYNMMASLDFLPNSPTLMNAGRELGQLSACFVLPIEDSMESIFDTVKNTALIHKSGGGTGFSFSRLRPEQDRVGSTGGVASGPVSFMRAFDVATDVIKQGGTRRGANMAILSVDHPDIEKFIHAKSEGGVLTNFNLSVAITAKFMEAVQSDGDYALINPHTKKEVRRISARKIFSQVVEMAWKGGDPGIVFIDRINKNNPTPHLGQIESTNPCGEQPLLPYESCNLGSINLSNMLTEKQGKTEIDYEKIRSVMKLAVRFLDDVIEVNKYPIEQISEMSRSTRKIGLGVMGFADMLIRLGIPYNTEEALKTGEKLMQFVNDTARELSEELALERGIFPAYEGSIYDKAGGPKLRNAARTTIAPTGTLSLIAGCSSGIEPLFALSFKRNILDSTNMVEVNPYFEKAAKDGGFYSEDLMEKLAMGEHLADMEEVPEDVKKLFVTAHEITPEWHVKMQAAFQRHTDNAVSKTVNFPKEATKEDVENVYNLAFEEGLKGITIYRDGSLEAQPMSTGKTAKEAPKEEAGVMPAPRKRAKVTKGVTERVTTGCGYIYVTVNSDEQGICEVFASLGKAGGCASAQLEATCRLISLALRSGMDVGSVARQMRGIRCPSIAWESGKAVLSCADAIASVLEKYINGGYNETGGDNGNGKLKDNNPGQGLGKATNIAGQCPDCGSILVYQEGCFICPGCGYTKC